MAADFGRVPLNGLAIGRSAYLWLEWLNEPMSASSRSSSPKMVWCTRSISPRAAPLIAFEKGLVSWAMSLIL